MKYLLFALVGFACGSVLYSYIICKLVADKDIVAQSRDKNPGASNAFAAAGKVVGSACLALDILKGFLPVFISTYYLDPTCLLFAAVIAAPTIGHAFSPMLLGKGGKAIAVTFGSLFGVVLISKVGFMLAFLFIFFSAIVIICPHRVRVLTTMGCFMVFAIFFENNHAITLGCVLISIVVIIKHLKKPEDEERDIYFFKKKA